jgi:hypothetical protein
LLEKKGVSQWNSLCRLNDSPAPRSKSSPPQKKPRHKTGPCDLVFWRQNDQTKDSNYCFSFMEAGASFRSRSRRRREVKRKTLAKITQAIWRVMLYASGERIGDYDETWSEIMIFVVRKDQNGGYRLEVESAAHQCMHASLSDTFMSRN